MGEMEKTMLHFVLVHGAFHGAWCWYKLSTLLSSAGCRVTTLDMATSGIDTKRVEEIQSISDYCMPLMEFMGSLPPEEKVILVGHSFGGLGISLAMERFPANICVAVFVTAFMPGPTLSYRAIKQESSGKRDSSVDQRHRSPPASVSLSAEALASKFYQLCPPEDLTLATMLVRPTGAFSDADILKKIVLSKEKYGSVHRVYIVSDEDNIIKENLQRWMIQKNPPDVVKVITGSDHMVMLSKPQELFTCLMGIAENYN